MEKKEKKVPFQVWIERKVLEKFVFLKMQAQLRQPAKEVQRGEALNFIFDTAIHQLQTKKGQKY